MNRKALRKLTSIPGVYPLLAFLTARRVVVRGTSMLPTLAPGERVLCDRLAYRSGNPVLGDVVLARHPARPGLRMLKRVAGESAEEFTLLGDHPEESTDSRQLGPFRAEDILARAWIVYWPPQRVRHL